MLGLGLLPVAVSSDLKTSFTFPALTSFWINWGWSSPRRRARVSSLCLVLEAIGSGAAGRPGQRIDDGFSGRARQPGEHTAHRGRGRGRVHTVFTTAGPPGSGPLHAVVSSLFPRKYRVNAG